MIFFAQQKPETQRIIGYNCPITETPHYKYLTGDKKPYIDYLRASWGTSVGITEQCEKFDKLLADIQLNGLNEPIELCRNGIIDGNHRAAIMTYLNWPIEYVEITESEYYAKLLKLDGHRYGTQPGKPYQSVFVNAVEVIEGRRRDTLERAEKIGRLDGKTVIDFGCNIGAASLLAAQYGAKSVTGIESVYDIALAACRINALYGYNIMYDCADLSKPYKTEPCDVGFVFSLDQHVNNDAQLAENIRANVKELVYFECHPSAKIPSRIAKIFKRIDRIGVNYDHRAFFRCEL